MTDVFISYSKADRAIAEALANDLTASGFNVWWDFQLYAGDDFHDIIREAIANAKATIVIWSETAVASKWVRGEAIEASDLNTLISTHAPNFDPKKVPLNFRALHCEPIANLNRIIAAIERKGVKSEVATAPLLRPGSIPDLQYRSARGEAKAQDELGYIYYAGFDVKKDHDKAAQLFRMAADQGLPNAQFNFALCHEAGEGVARNRTEAIRLLRLAADQGHVDAKWILKALEKN